MSSLLPVILIPLLPLISFLILGIFGNSSGALRTISGAFATVMMLLSCLLAVSAAAGYFTAGEAAGAFRPSVVYSLPWLNFGDGISIDIGILFDSASSMMLVVVTFVSLMVHLFSIGYMKGEKRFHTYYAFLGLFTFSMLGLVMSANIFQIYIFWELVGVSSFLLIGYYFDKPSAVAAAKKAFIVTRFADLGFLIGILTLGFYSESFDFLTIINRLTDAQSPQFMAISAASFAGISTLTWGLVLVFIGGAGKSAMFPLHIWLPDAMEGPTPVSALIHAATMVVAGVYLVARLFPVFALGDGMALHIVMYTGVVSAIIAAIVACTQTDIKRVLAYSTMSQIGYMMFALGVSGYGAEEGAGFSASLFHLFTHAFFKSLMFLGAGAIIHAVHSNDLAQMGGLRKRLPITHITFLIGCLAISGIPPFAGFFSKEEILHAAYHHHPVVYYMAVITSGLTAFYMFRLYYGIFWSKPAETAHDDHHGEGEWTMMTPLVILGLLSVVAGFVPFSDHVSSDGNPLHSGVDLMFSIVPVTVAVIGIAVATWMYRTASDRPTQFANALGGFYVWAKHKFYIDELYLFITKRVLFNLIGRPAAWIDKHVVDGFWYLTALITSEVSSGIRAMQSGKLQSYALYFFGGILWLALVVLFLIK